MNKFLGLLILFIFIINIDYANAISNVNKKRLAGFNKWLHENGHHELVKEAQSEVCKSEAKYSNLWYYNKCDQPQYKNNLKIKLYDFKGKKSTWIPNNEKPNYDTLLFQLYNWTYSALRDEPIPDKYEIGPSKKPFKFKTSLRDDKYINKQLEKTALISYLLFEDGKITIDKFTPKNRFGKFINKKTKLRSNSVGKSMVSYVVGHAICEGYIDSVHARLNDWPLIENTLYHDQKLIDILNMYSGDQEYITSVQGLKKDIVDTSSINVRWTSFSDHQIDLKKMVDLFKNTKKSKPEFSYHSLNTSLALNYVLFKTGNQFEKILEKTFKKKAQIEDGVYFHKVPNSSKERGDANVMFYATRYDYLRIAKAMMDDWQNDTCEGKYLKTLFKNSVDKENKKKKKLGIPIDWDYADRYAGQFHTHYKGFDKERELMGMHGLGGQHMVIDFDRSRIIITNSIYQNHNYQKSIFRKIKKGK